MRPIAILALVVLAACDRSPTAPAKSLLVTASVTPSVIANGETVGVQIVFTNRGSETQTVSPNQGTCGLAYDVLRTDGTDTHVGDYTYCESAAIEGGFSVEPGSTYTVTQYWDTKDWPLAVGTYLVRGSLEGAGIVNVPTVIQITQ